MKKKLLLICLLWSISFLGIAQNDPNQPPPPNGRKPPQENMEGLKIAFVTKFLQLTPEEAQKFWPVYNGYTDQVKKLRRDQKEDEIAFEEKLLAERKKLKVDMKKILGTDERANKALTIDREFNNAIRKELQDRKGANNQAKRNKQNQ